MNCMHSAHIISQAKQLVLIWTRFSIYFGLFLCSVFLGVLVEGGRNFEKCVYGINIKLRILTQKWVDYMLSDAISEIQIRFCVLHLWILDMRCK